MVSSEENEEAMYTAFTVTVDAREGISTGISAEDRARTLRMLSDSATQPLQLRKPGHICPLRYISHLMRCVQACSCMSPCVKEQQLQQQRGCLFRLREFFKPSPCSCFAPEKH